MSNNIERLRKLVRRLLGRRPTRLALAGIALGAASLVFLVTSPALAGSAAHGGHGDMSINWFGYSSEKPPVGWFILNFIAFVAGLAYLLKKPLREGFKKRHETIKNAIHAAEEAHRKAKAHHDEYQAKLANIKDEVEQLVDGARHDGGLIRDQLVADAEKYAEGLRKDSTHAAEQELHDAEERLKLEAVADVLQRAHALLHRELSDADKTRLLEEAIVALERDGNAPATSPSRGRGAEGSRESAIGGAA